MSRKRAEQREASKKTITSRPCETAARGKARRSAPAAADERSARARQLCGSARTARFPAFPPAFWWIVLIAGALRLLVIPAEGLWADEVYGYFDAWRPLWRRLQTVHAAHFILARGFVEFWDSGLAIRLQSAVFAIATFPFFYALAECLLGRRWALAATLYLAVSSYHFHYSFDANYYSELIFCATVGLWFAARHLQGRHPFDAVLAMIALGAGFFFHPFGGVLAGLVFPVLVAHALVRRDALLMFWPPVWIRAGRPVIAWLLALLEIGVVLGLFLVVLPKSRGFLQSAVQELTLGATPRNYRFFPDLIFEYFRGNLSDYPLSSRLAAAPAWAFVLAAATGAATALRRRFWIGMLFLVPFAGSFLLIANLKANHHFYIRYFSYLYPILSVWLLWGVAQLSRWSGDASADPDRDCDGPDALLSGSKRWPLIALGVLYAIGIAAALALKWNRADAVMLAGWIVGAAFLAYPLAARLVPLARRHAAMLLLGVVLVVNGAVSVQRFVFRDTRNWKAAVEVWKREARPGQPVLWEHEQEGEMLRYYLPRVGLSYRDSLRLIHGMPSAELRLAQLKGFARTLPEFWYLRGWDIFHNPPDEPWARKRLELKADAPSSFEPFLNVQLFRGALADRYLQWPYGLRMEFQADEQIPVPSGGVSGWERTLEVEEASTFALRLLAPEAANAAPAPPPRFRVLVDGIPGSWSQPPRRVLPIFIGEGQRRLGIELDRSEGVGTTSFSEPPRVVISPLDLPEGVRFPATQLTIPFSASVFCVADTYEGRQVLRLGRNLGIQYWMDFPEAGTYELRVEAVHDKGHWDQPRPVWLDVALDDQFQGILPFSRGDNSWDEKGFPLRIATPGPHGLAINFISQGPPKFNLPPDEDLHAILGYLSLRRLAEGESVPDDRLVSNPAAGPVPRTLSIPLANPQTQDPLPGWTITAKTGPVVIASEHPQGLQRHPAVEVEIPFDCQGVWFVAPPRPTPPSGSLLHAEALVGACRLVNQSVVLGLLFLDESGSTVNGSILFGQESTFRSADSLRFALAATVPPGAVRYAPVINVFPNGNRPATDSGWVRFAAMHVGEYKSPNR